MTDVKEMLLNSIADAHSGTATEGNRIADAILTASGFSVVPTEEVERLRISETRLDKAGSDVRYLLAIIDTATEDDFDLDEDTQPVSEIKADYPPSTAAKAGGDHD